MKKEIRFSYLAGYYPTERSRKIRYREVKDCISLTIPEVKEKDFPIIIKCSDWRSQPPTVFRGYNGRLMRPVCHAINFYTYRTYKNCDYFNVCEDAEKNPYIPGISVDVPDYNCEKLCTRSEMIKIIKNDYSSKVYFENNIWDTAAEPYISVDNDYISISFSSLDCKLNPAMYQFRIDDWVNIYSNRFVNQKNSCQLDLAKNYEDYLHLNYRTESEQDPRYHLNMNRLPDIVYVFGPEYIVNGKNVYLIRAKIGKYAEYTDDIYEFRVNASSEDEALGKFFRKNQSVTYKNIISVEKE